MTTETAQTLLREIKTTTGWSEPRIATEIGTSQATVNRLLNGQPECKSSTWRAITELRERLKRSASRVAKDRPARKPPSVQNLKQ